MAFKYYKEKGEFGLDANRDVLGSTTFSGEAFPKAPVDRSADAEFYSNAFTWEPKYQNRFIMTLGSTNIPAYIVKASSKPSLENGEIVLDHINVQRKVKGKSKWQNITLTLYDPIIPSGAQAVMDWVRDHHESATGRDGYSSVYKQKLTLQGLSGPGEVIEEWTLEGAFITSCNWGQYDWSAEEVNTNEMTISYDFAFMHF